MYAPTLLAKREMTPMNTSSSNTTQAYSLEKLKRLSRCDLGNKLCEIRDFYLITYSRHIMCNKGQNVASKIE